MFANKDIFSKKIGNLFIISSDKIKEIMGIINDKPIISNNITKTDKNIKK